MRDGKGSFLVEVLVVFGAHSDGGSVSVAHTVHLRDFQFVLVYQQVYRWFVLGAYHCIYRAASIALPFLQELLPRRIKNIGSVLGHAVSTVNSPLRKALDTSLLA